MPESRHSILVTDDDKDIRSILRLKLEAAGFIVTEAENGQAALDASAKQRPDLIVMDVDMPVMTGTETIAKMKENPALVGVQVIFLSNYGEKEQKDAWIDQKYARELGAVDYLKKTDDLDVIVTRVKELING